MSLPEVLLWQALRERHGGLKFRRQFPIGPITTDFACLERRLTVEVDGEQHGMVIYRGVASLVTCHFSERGLL
jgi:very-short-patch-repair endonuclease